MTTKIIYLNDKLEPTTKDKATLAQKIIYEGERLIDSMLLIRKGRN